MGNFNIKKELIQAEWIFHGYYPENCYEVTKCEPSVEQRIKTVDFES